MIAVSRIVERLRRATFVQAARSVQGWARSRGNPAEVGRDALPAHEPLRFVASDRMHVPANDVAGAEAGGGGGAGRGKDAGEQVRVVSNVLGLAGATPALPPPYSELQLQRRRARDFAFGHFLSIFDHRALSFFWRIAEKYSWPLMAERTRGRAGAEGAEGGAGLGGDPIQGMLVTLAGIGYDGARDRLDMRDRSLVTLVGHLADTRRSAASVETVLRTLTGLPLRVVEATPTWMAVPPSEQTRIGGLGSQFSQLGQLESDDSAGQGSAAMIGSAVLDAQHHYVVEIGPLSYSGLQDFCSRREARRRVTQICALAAGIEQRPSIRLRIATSDIPELRLGDAAQPAMLGWTTWMGEVVREGGIADDCLIPIDPTAITGKAA